MSNLSSSAQTAALIASMQAAAQARLAASANMLPPALRVALAPFAPPQSEVHLTESECAEIDMAMHLDKLWTGNPPMDGYERRRQAKALTMEQRSRRFA